MCDSKVILEKSFNEFKELHIPFLSSPQAPWRSIESYALHLSSMCLFCTMKPAAVLLDHFDAKTH